MNNTNNWWNGFEFERVVFEISHFEIFIIFQVNPIFKLSYLPNYNSYEKNKGIFGIPIKMPIRQMVTWTHLGQSNFSIFFSIFEKLSDFAKSLWARAQYEYKHCTKISWKSVAYFWFGGYFNIFSLDIFVKVWASDWRSFYNATALKFWAFIDNEQY